MELIIEEHEEAAEIAFGSLLIAAALLLVTFVFIKMKSQSANLLVKLTLIVSLAASGLMARTGYLGGLIRHTEIRGDTIKNINTEAESGNKDSSELEKEE